MQPLIEPEHLANVQIGLISQLEGEPARNSSNPEQNQPIPNTIQFYVEKILKNMGIPLHQTMQCKHRGSCISATISSSLKGGFYGYLIKSGLSIVFQLRALIKKPKIFLESFTSKDSAKFLLFALSFIFSFRAIVCLLRRKISSEKSKYVFFIAGLISGTLAVLNLDKKTRQSFALFLISRALDSTYHTLVQKGYLPKFKYYYVLLYSLMMFVTGGIALSSQPGSLAPEVNKFYLSFIGENANDQQMRRIWIERKNNDLGLKGFAAQDPIQFMPTLRKALGKKYLS